MVTTAIIGLALALGGLLLCLAAQARREITRERIWQQQQHDLAKARAAALAVDQEWQALPERLEKDIAAWEKLSGERDG